MRIYPYFNVLLRNYPHFSILYKTRVLKLDALTSSSRIKDLCKEKRITVKSLLETTGISRSFIYDLEKGRSVPSADKFERIADYLDCSVDYLLGRTDVPEVNRGGNGQGRPTRPSE